MYKTIEVYTDGTIQVLEHDSNELTLEYLQKVVGGYIEIVRCPFNRHILIAVYENGKIEGQEQNDIGTLLYGNPFDNIVGDIVIACDISEGKEPDIYAMPEFIYNDISKIIYQNFGIEL